MKYLNIYLLDLLTIFIVGCSDDDPAMNSASTTVSFTQSEVTFNENAGIVKVPLTIEGERNGMIKVTFKVEDGSAIVNEHYIVTTTTVYIPTDANDTFGCEIRLLDDGMTENDDRNLKVTIENVEGAQTGATSTCNVILKDVDKNPYFKLMGTWTFNAVKATDGSAVSFTVTISDGGDEANLEKSYVFNGFTDGKGYDATIPWTVDYNKASETLSVVQGPTYAKYNFGFVGEVRVCPMDLTAALSKSLEGTWNETFDRIDFDPNGIIGVGVFDSGEYAGYWAVYAECYMVKK